MRLSMSVSMRPELMIEAQKFMDEHPEEYSSTSDLLRKSLRYYITTKGTKEGGK